MDAYPREAWKRLGQHLRQRRPQLDTRYRIRKVFAQEHGLTDKTVQEIENAYRETFSDVMLSTVERAYQLKPGSIERFLAGQGDLEPTEPVAHVSQIALHAPEPTSSGVRVERRSDSHVTYEVTVESGLTMDEAIASLGELTEHEELLVHQLRIMKFEPDQVKGAVLLLRRGQPARRAGPDAGRMRKNA